MKWEAIGTYQNGRVIRISARLMKDVVFNACTAKTGTEVVKGRGRVRELGTWKDLADAHAEAMRDRSISFEGSHRKDMRIVVRTSRVTNGGRWFQPWHDRAYASTVPVLAIGRRCSRERA